MPNLFKYCLLSCCVTLAACGGGEAPVTVDPDTSDETPSGNTGSVIPSTGEGNGGNVTPPVSSGVALPDGLQNLRTFADGQQMVRFYNPQTDEIFVGLTGGNSLLSELENNTLTNFQNVSLSIEGDRFEAERTAQTSTNETIDLVISGLNLTSGGEEYVARVFMTSPSEGTAYVVAGAPVQQLQNASATYAGVAEIVVSNTATGAQLREVGNFDLSLDFSQSAPIGRISGATDGYIFVGASVALDKETTALSSSSVEIGPVMGATQTATLAGNIMGTTGSGVGGIIVSDDTGGAAYLASFYGTLQ